MSAVKLAGLLMCLAALSLPAAALAEGPTPEEGTTPAVPSQPKKHKKPVAKKAAPPVTPTAPIPYATYKGPSADMAKALTPSAPVAAIPSTPIPNVAATPDMLPQPVETTPPPPPPPPPSVMPAVPQMAAAPPPASSPDEISLRCETQTSDGKKLVSQGSFYIDLFPSPVFPDQHADFKFLLADPNHKSLIRDSICLDTICSAEVSGQAYYLVSTRTKKGKALRITLDRVKGAFYAEKVDGKDHLGEQGYCTPQALPKVMF